MVYRAALSCVFGVMTQFSSLRPFVWYIRPMFRPLSKINRRDQARLQLFQIRAVPLRVVFCGAPCEAHAPPTHQHSAGDAFPPNGHTLLTHIAKLRLLRLRNNVCSPRTRAPGRCEIRSAAPPFGSSFSFGRPSGNAKNKKKKMTKCIALVVVLCVCF